MLGAGGTQEHGSLVLCPAQDSDCYWWLSQVPHVCCLSLNVVLFILPILKILGFPILNSVWQDTPNYHINMQEQDILQQSVMHHHMIQRLQQHIKRVLMKLCLSIKLLYEHFLTTDKTLKFNPFSDY